MYKPSSPFTTPALILKGSYEKVNGINKKVFSEGRIIFVSAKSYGGTETVVNGKHVIIDTIDIECWYHPDITSKDGLRLLDDNSEWEIINNPEDIERRHQFLKFKIQRRVGNG